MILEDSLRYTQNLLLEWRSVIKFEGLYEVSENGDIWSHKQNKLLARNRNVVLHKRGEDNKIVSKTFSTIMLVAQAFVPNPNKLKFVKFIDKKSKDTHFKNLIWSHKHTTSKIKTVLIDEERVLKQFKEYGKTTEEFRKAFYPQVSITSIRKVVKYLCNLYCENPPNSKNEQWRSISGDYKHFYISTAGRVWSSTRKVLIKTCSNGKCLIFVNKKTNSKGVLSSKTFSVHILVAKLFLKGYIQKKHDIVFKDGDKFNPQLYNLDFQLKTLRAANFRPIKTK